MKNYPYNPSREQFEKIRPILESARKKTKPRKSDLYAVFCGVLYVLRSGCQWDMLPGDFPNYKSVHAYFMKWNRKRKDEKMNELPGILEEVLKKIGWSGPYRQWSEREDIIWHN